MTTPISQGLLLMEVLIVSSFVLHEKECSTDAGLFDSRYADKFELASLLSMSVRTVERNSYRIKGRVKIGRSVRYFLPDVHKALLSGKNLFE